MTQSGSLVISANCRAKVDFPAPAFPNTATRFMACCNTTPKGLRLRAVLSQRGYKGSRPLLLAADANAAEAGVEARQSAAAIEKLLRSASPSRMGVRIDVQVQRRALFAISRAGHEFDAIGHDDLDHVVVGMDIGLHASVSGKISKEPSGEPAALSIRAPITRAAR